MNKDSSRKLLDVMENSLKELTTVIAESCDTPYELEHKVAEKVHSKMGNLTRSMAFKSAIPRTSSIRNIRYQPSSSKNGIITGKIIIEHCQKRDTFKYDGPGYPGKEDGQLCEYPKNSRKFYKWNSAICKWQDIYHSLRHNNETQEPNWYDKLMNNAAFEPWWGNNPSMDGIKSDRKRNGAKDLWGDPGVRKFNSTFKQITADVMQSVYNFAYDFRVLLNLSTKINESLGLDNEVKKSNDSNDISIPIETPKDTVTYNFEAKYIETVSNKHYNGYRKEVQGYEQAQKDSTYQVNRSDASIRVEVQITKKY